MVISEADRTDKIVVSNLRFMDGLQTLVLAPVYLLLLIEPEQFGRNCGAGFRDRRPLRELGRGLSIAGYTDGLAESNTVAGDNR